MSAAAAAVRWAARRAGGLAAAVTAAAAMRPPARRVATGGRRAPLAWARSRRAHHLGGDRRGTASPATSATSNDELPNQLRAAMGHVPSPAAFAPVVVVTTAVPSADAAARPAMHGVTVGSFTSISLRPPIVSFAIRPPSRMVDLLQESGRFVAHVLRKDQVHLSLAFSGQRPSGADQFRDVPYYLDPNGLPVLLGSLVVLQGRLDSAQTVGDHVLYLGQVTSVHVGPPSEPLLYYGRQYHSIGDQAFMQGFEDATLQAQLWTHEGHVRMAWNYLRVHDRATAMRLIRDGLKRFIVRNRHLVRHPYNETVTQFFVHLIAKADLFGIWQGIEAAPDETEFYHWLARHPELRNPALVYDYYSKDRVHSVAAQTSYGGWLSPEQASADGASLLTATPRSAGYAPRRRFLPPDLKPLP